MKIVARLTGITDHHRTLDWPEGWPVPREGDSVSLLGETGLSVRTVVWYPEGVAGQDGGPEPFVYVVIGQPRR